MAGSLKVMMMRFPWPLHCRDAIFGWGWEGRRWMLGFVRLVLFMSTLCIGKFPFCICPEDTDQTWQVGAVGIQVWSSAGDVLCHILHLLRTAVPYRAI